MSDTGAVEAAVRETISRDVKGVRRVAVRFVVGKEGPAFEDEFVAGRSSDGEEQDHDHSHDQDHEHAHEHANGHSTSANVNGSAQKRK